MEALATVAASLIVGGGIGWYGVALVQKVLGR